MCSGDQLRRSSGAGGLGPTTCEFQGDGSGGRLKADISSWSPFAPSRPVISASAVLGEGRAGCLVVHTAEVTGGAEVRMSGEVMSVNGWSIVGIGRVEETVNMDCRRQERPSQSTLRFSCA